MKKIFAIIGIASLAFTSCAKDDAANDLSQNVIIKASFEQGGPNTRTGIDEDNTLTWTTNDAFALFGDGSSAEFILQGTGGSSIGTFTGTPPATILGAAFPYTNENNPALNGSTLTMTLLAELDQTTHGVCNLPMWAATSSADNISFKHLAGVLRVKLNNVPEGYNSLLVAASAPISSEFTATTSDTVPVLVSESEKTTDKQVAVKFTAATAEANDYVLYIPLPVATYSSIEVSISNGTDTKELITYTNKEVERAEIYTANLTYSSVTGTLATEVDNSTELTDALKAGKAVILTDDIDLEQSITIPSGVNAAIDLNGNTLTGASDEVNAITISGNLSLVNGKVVAVKDTAFNVTGGKLTLDDCDIEGCTVAVVSSNGTLQATNCDAAVTQTAYAVMGGANMTLTGCNASTSSTTGSAVVTANGAGSVLTIDGGTYTGSPFEGAASDKYVIGVKGGSSATINTTVSGGNGGVAVYGNSKADFTGGSYSALVHYGLYVKESTVTYTDNCTFDGKAADICVDTQGKLNETDYTTTTTFDN